MKRYSVERTLKIELGDVVFVDAENEQEAVIKGRNFQSHCLRYINPGIDIKEIYVDRVKEIK